MNLKLFHSIIGILSFAVCLLFSSCSVDKHSSASESSSDTLDEKTRELKLSVDVDSVMYLIGLVDLHNVDSRILLDLRYASDNNFMHRVLYDTLSTVYLQRDVAEKLKLVQDFLDSLNHGYRLKVYDGVRPVQVQREMWNSLDTIPTSNRGRFVSNPALGSVHNFGAAVDVTIVDEKGNELDMGAGYDDFRKIAFPSLEGQFLASGELSQIQVNNRRLLRRVMRSQGFSNIPSEWWHFNAVSRIQAANKYPMLVTEGGKHRNVQIIYRDSVSILVDRKLDEHQ